MFQNAIDVCVQVGVVAKRQVPLENHAVEAAQNGYNGSGEPLDESSGELHGVLLPMACVTAPS